MDVPAGSIVPPVIRALTELFLVAEDLALVNIFECPNLIFKTID